MDAIELKATLETKISKAGKPYDVVYVYLNDTYKKAVFLEEAEKELIKQSMSRKNDLNLEMPDFLK